MIKSKKPWLKVKVEGRPRGFEDDRVYFTTVRSVPQGVRKIGIRLGLFQRNAPAWQVVETFAHCTISFRELPDGNWVVVPPDE